MMRRLPLATSLMGAALMALGVAPAPAAAQDGNYRTRTVVIFGNDECPKAANPDEIVICARRPEEDRYRIPKEIREADKAAATRRADDVAASRAALASGRPSATGAGSCSTVGAGGASGCTRGLDVVNGVRTVIEGVKTATEPDDR